jgi:hypothetical protein
MVLKGVSIFETLTDETMKHKIALSLALIFACISQAQVTDQEDASLMEFNSCVYKNTF